MSGERSSDRAHVLLIGETGAGKSTFINYLCNYFQQGDLDHLRIAIPSKYHPYPTEQFASNEWNLDDATQSKTNLCTPYTFTERTTGKTYLFLDTPGLSDTRGVEQNEMNVNQIVEAVIRLGRLTTVIIVVNGALNRLSSNLRSVIATLHDHLPDSILNNVIVLLTNVKKHQSTFDLRVLNLHGQVYPFYMQNDAFASDPRTWEASAGRELQLDWNHSMHQIANILQTIDTSAQRSVDSCVKMRNKQYELKGAFHRLRLKIVELQRIQNELACMDGIRHQILEKIEIVDGPSYNMLCAVCNQVCQYDCRGNETGTQRNGQVSSSPFPTLMTHGTCQEGHCRCSLANHYQAKTILHRTRETLRDALLALKQQSSQRLSTRAELSQILERIFQQGIGDIRHRATKLIHICSSFHFHADFDLFIHQLLVESDFPHDPNIALQNEMIVQRITILSHLIAENQEKLRRKQPSPQIIDRDQSKKQSSIDVTHATTTDLVEFYAKNSDPSLMFSILNELHRRAQGKSTDPLSTPSDITAINRYHGKHKDKTVQELSYVYRQLQKQINEVIQSNILQIVRVPKELLIENLSVQALLEEKEKREIDQPSTTRSFPLVDGWPFPQPDTSLMPPPSNRASPHLTAESKSSSPGSTLIGFSRILSASASAPYPFSDNMSPMPPLPQHFPTLDAPRSNPTTIPIPRITVRDSSAHRKTQGSLNENNRVQSMPMPPPPFSQMPQLQRITPGFQASFTGDHSSIPDVIPPSSMYDMDQSQSFAPSDSEDFDSLSNTRLISMYKEAMVTNNQSERDAVHQELERRCFGLYPQLLKENEDLFREKLQMCQKKPVDKLVADQAALAHNIRMFLENDNVTLINDIPAEMIVEAAVYAFLLKSATGV